jgi:hypothetical protein
MIRTEQLSSDTIMFHVQGVLHAKVAKELSLSVLCSYHLGFRIFLCNLSRAILLDKAATYHLALIGEGLRDKGRTWKIIQPPSSDGDELILRTRLQHLSFENWN